MAHSGRHDASSAAAIGGLETGTLVKSAARAWYALAVLVLATLFAFVDRQILVLVVEPLKHDLALRDVQIGALQGLGFATFSVVAAIPLAWLADRFERSFVLLGCVLVWSAATAACGFADSFATLFACTVGVAIGEAALVPIVFSLIPDLFPGPSRMRANIIYFASNVLGVGLGLALAGVTLGFVESVRSELPQGLRALAGWRLTFIAVALPGPLIALAIGLIGTTHRAARALHSHPSTNRLIGYFRVHGRTALSIFVAAGFGQVAAGAFFIWMPVAMVRAFNVTPATVGTNFGLTYTVGSAVGLALAAVTTPLWRQWVGVVAVPRALSVTSALVVIPTVLLGFAVHPWQVYLLEAALVSLVITGAALAPTMLQDITPPALRARLIALSTVITVVMAAAAPVTVGALSDSTGATPRGLLWAIIAVMSFGMTLCALCYRVSEAPFRRTVRALQSAHANIGN